MADDSPPLLLIVTGSTLRAEELDRPLAYYLKQQVELASERLDLAFRTLVVADFRWMNDDPLQSVPTISVGGPGVNHLAQTWFDEVPFSLAVDEQYCIQMDPNLAEPRVSIWGMDNATTQIAVSVFINRFLPRFLEHAANHVPDPAEPEDSDEVSGPPGPRDRPGKSVNGHRSGPNLSSMGPARGGRSSKGGGDGSGGPGWLRFLAPGLGARLASFPRIRRGRFGLNRIKAEELRPS